MIYACFMWAITCHHTIKVNGRQRRKSHLAFHRMVHKYKNGAVWDDDHKRVETQFCRKRLKQQQQHILVILIITSIRFICTAFFMCRRLLMIWCCRCCYYCKIVVWFMKHLCAKWKRSNEKLMCRFCRSHHRLFISMITNSDCARACVCVSVWMHELVAAKQRSENWQNREIHTHAHINTLQM